jgi:hypothetical protein
MNNFVDKPEDYDDVVHGETRFVIFEKREDVSKIFYFRMKYYWKVTRKKVLSILESLTINIERA